MAGLTWTWCLPAPWCCAGVSCTSCGPQWRAQWRAPPPSSPWWGPGGPAPAGGRRGAGASRWPSYFLLTAVHHRTALPGAVYCSRRMKSSRCLYFNEISQTNHQHQQSDIKNSSADHLGIISRLPNVSDGDLEIFSSVQSDELTEWYQDCNEVTWASCSYPLIDSSPPLTSLVPLSADLKWNLYRVWRVELVQWGSTSHFTVSR